MRHTRTSIGCLLKQIMHVHFLTATLGVCPIVALDVDELMILFTNIGDDPSLMIDSAR